MYLRVGDDSSLDAAKPVKEGLSDQAWQGILQRCGGSPVRPSCLTSITLPCCLAEPGRRLSDAAFCPGLTSCLNRTCGTSRGPRAQAWQGNYSAARASLYMPAACPPRCSSF